MKGKLAMRKALRVAVLTLALSCSIYAGEMPFGVTATGVIPNGVTANGEIPNGVTNPPPPQTMKQTSAAETAGDIPYGRPEGITTAVLNLLQTVLALL